MVCSNTDRTSSPTRKLSSVCRRPGGRIVGDPKVESRDHVSRNHFRIARQSAGIRIEDHDSHAHSHQILFYPQCRRCRPRIAQIVRAAILNCSRNQWCAGSVVSRGCHAMKYGKALISRGGSTTRTPVIGAVTSANLRGTVRIRSV